MSGKFIKKLLLDSKFSHMFILNETSWKIAKLN